MSQQYPGPQQPYNQQPYQGPYVGGPAPYQPPPEPKKFMSGWAIAGIIIGSIFTLLFILGLMVSVSDDSSTRADNKAATASSSAPAKAAPEKKDEAPEKSKPAEKPAAAKPNEYTEGDYVVGEDIPAGTYETSGAKKGFFELCSISTEPTADGVMPKWKTANANERIIITLSKDDGIVSIQGCEPLRPRS